MRSSSSLHAPYPEHGHEGMEETPLIALSRREIEREANSVPQSHLDVSVANRFCPPLVDVDIWRVEFRIFYIR